MAAVRERISKTAGQRWWHEKKLAIVESKASEIRRQYELKHGRQEGIVHPELIASSVLGLQICYFSDDERRDYGIPKDAIGALDPITRTIYVYENLRHKGREAMTIAEEIGHFVLHAPLVTPNQASLDFDNFIETNTSGDTYFCRSESGFCSDQGREKPYMTREAEFFAACLLLPKDRFVPQTIKFLRVAWREEYREYPFPTNDNWYRNIPSRKMIAILDRIVNLLHAYYKSGVSFTCLRIRLSEVGLAPTLSGQKGQEGLEPLSSILDRVIPDIFSYKYSRS